MEEKDTNADGSAVPHVRFGREAVANVAEVAARLLLGGIFIYTGLAKILDPETFAEAVAGFQMLPEWAIDIVVYSLPAAEIAAGAALVFTKWSRIAAFALVGMFAVFLVALVQAKARGLQISCGCFGGDPGEADSLGSAIVRDIVLLVPTVWLAWRRPNRLIGGPILLVVSAIVMVIVAALAVRAGRLDAAGGPPPAAVPTLAKASTDIPTVATNLVEAEKWTHDFPSAIATAVTNGRPIMMLVTNKGCNHCKTFHKMTAGRVFRKWLAGSGIYLAEARAHMTNSIPAEAQLAKFLENSPPLNEMYGYPYLGFYWKKPDGTEVRTVLSGRQRKMLSKTDQSSLVSSFMETADFLIGEYLSSLPGRLDSDGILNATAKRIQATVSGRGKVVVSPASGNIRDDGRPVLLVPRAAKGAVFSYWRDPKGKRIKKKRFSNNLVVTYDMPSGTYTAVFKDR